MTDTLYVSFLRAGDKILNPDGTITEQFRNAWNALVLRTGTQVTSALPGVLNGVAQARAEALAAAALAEAASQQANNAVSGAGGSPAFYITPDTYTASDSIPTAGAVTTNSVTVTPTGGTGPFTYAWAYVSGDTFTVNAPTAATTTFSTSILLGSSKEGVYDVTATDSLALTAKTTISVSAYSESTAGGGGIIP